MNRWTQIGKEGEGWEWNLSHYQSIVEGEVMMENPMVPDYKSGGVRGNQEGKQMKQSMKLRLTAHSLLLAARDPDMKGAK